MSEAGRSCPLAYRYGPHAIARAPVQEADTLYVIGGLYGNPFALAALEALCAQEPGPVRLCFNGDFNWFNIDDANFRHINEYVLRHDAIVGNVEFEFRNPADDAGCGCAYPDEVSAATVERSNRIHARLKHTANRHPDILAQLATLPLFARYQIGGCRVGIVHGDADSLAGWAFDPDRLDQTGAPHASFQAAEVDVFASTHTCQAGMRHFQWATQQGLIANNGAAGMPNFKGRLEGLITRISRQPSPRPSLASQRLCGIHIDALPLPYAQADWLAHFLERWPPGSAAHASYFERIAHGPHYSLAQAFP